MKAHRGWSTRTFLTIDEGTGEVISHARAVDYFTSMIHDVTSIVTQWMGKTELLARVENSDEPRIKPAEMGRRLGIGSSKDIPDGYPQPYRLLKMAQDNYITTARSFLNSGVEGKQLPSRAGLWLRFGAADRQITSIALRGQALEWRVLGPEKKWWIVTFPLPQRMGEPQRLSQPTIRLDRNEELFITLACEYQVNAPPRQTPRYVGVDLGRVIPYVATVTDSAGEVEAIHYASDAVVAANRKRLTAQAQCAALDKKVQQYEALGRTDLVASALDEKHRQITAMRRKEHAIAKETGREVVALAAQQNATLGMENLRWVKRSGKWKHGATNAWVEHHARFATVRTTLVDPAYTSSTCPCCESAEETYHSKRDVRCRKCRVSTDRDVAASVELSRRTRDKTGPTPKRPRKAPRRHHIAGEVNEVKHDNAPPARRVQVGGSCSHDWQGSLHSRYESPITYRDHRFF